jgi:hypothetical protein
MHALPGSRVISLPFSFPLPHVLLFRGIAYMYLVSTTKRGYDLSYALPFAPCSINLAYSYTQSVKFEARARAHSKQLPRVTVYPVNLSSSTTLLLPPSGCCYIRTQPFFEDFDPTLHSRTSHALTPPQLFAKLLHRRCFCMLSSHADHQRRLTNQSDRFPSPAPLF